MTPRKKPEPPQMKQILEQTQPEPKAETQVVQVMEPYIHLPAPPTPEEIVRQAAYQIYILKQYRNLFAKEVRPEQVLMFGDQIYLPARACQTLLGYARLRLKIHSTIHQHWSNSPDGEFIVFEAHATICTREGTEIDDVVASQSTRDEFFGLAGKEYPCPTCKTPCVWKKVNPNDEKNKTVCPTHGPVWVPKDTVILHYLPLYDVPIDDVLKKTTTNVFNRALQAIGMMPTIEDLKEAGMDVSRVKHIGFDGNRTASTQQQQGTPPPKQAAPHTQQSASQKPAQATSSQAPAATETRQGNSSLPRASIPPEREIISGSLMGIKPGVTKPKDKEGKPTGKPGREFLGLEIGPNKVTCFDNKELAIDTRGNKKRAFDLILEALNEHGSFWVEKRGQYLNVVGFIRIGNYEWGDDGLPVLRREAAPPQQESFGAQFEPDDSDIPL